MSSLLIGAQTFPTKKGCNNGGFENGNLVGWSGQYGKRTLLGINQNNSVQGFHPSRHYLTTQGDDPIIGGQLQMVALGNHSLRIGEPIGDKNYARVVYTFQVNSSNKDFSFMYAIVMQNAMHSSNTNPYFSYRINLGVNNSIFLPTIAQKTFVGNSNDPYWNVTGDYLWKNWQYECVDLSPYIGQFMTITFTSAGCNQGGHFCYTYLDGLCNNSFEPVASFTMPTLICYDEPLFADGTNSTNESSHFWAIQESNTNWQSIGVEYSQWYIAQQAGEINLKQLIESQGGTLKCNTYYKVKLATSNSCVPWKEVSKLVFVKCPDVPTLQNHIRCCGNNNITISLSDTKPPNLNNGNTYVWDVNPPVNFTLSAGGQIINFNSIQNHEITVTTTDSEGCSRTQTVQALNMDDFDLEIFEELIGCCQKKLTAKLTPINGCNRWDALTPQQQQILLGQVNYTWSQYGETTQSIIVGGNTSKEIYLNVNISNCSNKFLSYTYEPIDAWNNTLTYNRIILFGNAITPNGDGINDELVFTEYGPNAPLLGSNEPAYGAIGYRLRIFNRWGDMFREIKVDNCSIYQQQIRWDGKDSYGNFVSSGVYVFQLGIKTCSSGENYLDACNLYDTPGALQNAEYAGINSGDCVDKYWSFFNPFMQWVCTSYWNGPCAYKVTVIH
jgi:hypothetical protein